MIRRSNAAAPADYTRREYLAIGAALVPASLGLLGAPSSVPSMTALPHARDISVLRAMPTPPSELAVLVLGYNTPFDAGGGLYVWDADADSPDNGGTIIAAATRPRTGRWRLKHAGVLHVAQFGAFAGASGTTNRQAIQAAMDYVRAEGGEIVFEPRVVYAVDRPLDFRNHDISRRSYPRSLRGYGATLDFSASGLTSGALVSIGATALENAAETVWSNVVDLLIRGPEKHEKVEPRHSEHAFDARPPSDPDATTVVGLLVENATRVNVRNVYVSHCYKGIRYRRCWGGVYENTQVSKCIIGHHLDEGCTHVTFTKAQANACTFAYLMRPDVVSVGIGIVTMISPYAEDCTVGFHLDQNAARGTEIESVSIVDPYLEDVYSDGFRVGIGFDPVPANWRRPGPARTGTIVSLRVEGGRFAGAGATRGYGASRKAFRFAGQRNVASCRLVFPCTAADIENLPWHASLQSLARAEDTSRQLLDFEYPGFGLGRVEGGGATPFRKGNLAAVARVGVGRYDLRYRKSYASAEACIAIVTCRTAGHTASIDPDNSNAARTRVEVRNRAGELADGGFHVVLQGQLSPLGGAE